jgi:hypothetical protein
VVEHADEEVQRTLEGYERRFRRSGLPWFIENYTAAEDIFTRAAPLLGIVFVLQVLNAFNEDFSTWQNAGALVGGLAILMVATGLANRMRGRRFFAIPRRVGGIELTVFVLAPAVVPLVFGLQFGSAGLIVLGNLILLGVIYLVVGYSVLAIFRWAATRLTQELAASFRMLIFQLVLFINTEMWQVFATLKPEYLLIVIVFLVLAGCAFMAAGLPGEVERLEQDAGAAGPPLDFAARVNVGLVMFVSRALQVLVVSLAIGAFFVVFGAFSMELDVIELWIQKPTDVLLSIPFAGGEILVTTALLQVSAAVAAFSGLYYAVAILTDSTYRQEFIEGFTAELRDVFNDRVEYLRIRARHAG